MLLLLWKYDVSIQKDWVWIQKCFWIWMFLMDVVFYFWYPYDPMCLDFWYPYVPSNVQFGQDKKTQFLDKLQIFWKKLFLGHWDIGIRMNLQILNFWRVWENFEGGLDNIVRWYDGTGNMFRDDPEKMLSRDFYDFNQVWRIQTQISSAICKKNQEKSQAITIRFRSSS